MKAKVFFLKTGLLLCILAGFTGCTTFSKRRMETVSFRPLPHTELDELTFFIDNIEVEYAEPAVRTEYPLEEVLTNVGLKHGLRVLIYDGSEVPAGPKTFLLTCWLKEDDFVKDLNQLSSITAVFTLRVADSGALALRGVYTEESVETVESFYHVYSIFDYGLDKITDELTYYREKKRKR